MRFLNYCNDGSYNFPVINVKEVIEKVKTTDLIYDVTDTGIKLNRFIENCSKEDLILWIDPVNKAIKLERIGNSWFSGDLIIEKVEDFEITENEEIILFQFEETMTS